MVTFHYNRHEDEKKPATLQFQILMPSHEYNLFSRYTVSIFLPDDYLLKYHVQITSDLKEQPRQSFFFLPTARFWSSLSPPVCTLTLSFQTQQEVYNFSAHSKQALYPYGSLTFLSSHLKMKKLYKQRLSYHFSPLLFPL